MCLIADHQVPACVGDGQLLLDVFVARELVQAGNDQVVLDEPVPGACSLQLVVGQNLEGEMELLVEFVLPLLGQAAG